MSELAITLEEIKQVTFFDEEEANKCYNWLKRVIEVYPTSNTPEKLKEFIQLYKEMIFQST